MTRIERIGPATLILGDVLTALDGLPPVDAVITDPPYSSGGTHTAQRADDPRRRGVFAHPAPRRRVHVTQKPEGLMADLVEICAPGGVVLDPFMGSGTTGAAALRSGRGFVGVEKSAEFFEIACARLRETLTDMDSERAVAVADARARRHDRDAG